ncbi:MAG: hypothetical protein IPM77_15210 [Crocinitomicaceae bacterium]|nr:hypothetical protein [Crocinitomicaceae bacterium]
MVKYFNKHVYEIDILNTFISFKQNISNNTFEITANINAAEYLDRLWESIKVIVQPDDIDLDQMLQSKIPIVITPRYSLGHYEFWFAFQLMITNFRKIPLLLEYHLERWKGSIQFLNTLEFHILSIYEQNKPSNVENVTDTLYAWIVTRRKQFGFEKIKNVEDAVIIDEFYNVEVKEFQSKDLSKPLIMDQTILPDLLEILTKYLFDLNEKDKLEILLNGGSLTAPLKLNCFGNSIGFALITLKDKGKIISTKSSIGVWLQNNFLFRKEIRSLLKN